MPYIHICFSVKVNSLIRQGQIWRLATSSFLHANILHLMVTKLLSEKYNYNGMNPTALFELRNDTGKVENQHGAIVVFLLFFLLFLFLFKATVVFFRPN